MRTDAVLVTGAGGFIGSHLVEALLARGERVRAMVRYTSTGDVGFLDGVKRALNEERLEIVHGDIRDARAVRQAAAGCRRIYHLAALIGIPYSYMAPDSYVAVNVQGTLHVLEAAREIGAQRVAGRQQEAARGAADDDDRVNRPADPGSRAPVRQEHRARHGERHRTSEEDRQRDETKQPNRYAHGGHRGCVAVSTHNARQQLMTCGGGQQTDAGNGTGRAVARSIDRRGSGSPTPPEQRRVGVARAERGKLARPDADHSPTGANGPIALFRVASAEILPRQE